MVKKIVSIIKQFKNRFNSKNILGLRKTGANLIKIYHFDIQTWNLLVSLLILAILSIANLQSRFFINSSYLRTFQEECKNGKY